MLLTSPAIRPCITACPLLRYGYAFTRTDFFGAAISEGHGDTALLLLKSGAETDKKDVDGHLAIDLAPDTKVCILITSVSRCDSLTIGRYDISSCKARNAKVSF